MNRLFYASKIAQIKHNSDSILQQKNYIYRITGTQNLLYIDLFMGYESLSLLYMELATISK